jgi:hypothetical protein
VSKERSKEKHSLMRNPVTCANAHWAAAAEKDPVTMTLMLERCISASIIRQADSYLRYEE